MGAPGEARRLIEEAIALADVVKLSDEDIEWLCPGESLDDVIARVGRARARAARRHPRRSRCGRPRHVDR